MQQLFPAQAVRFEKVLAFHCGPSLAGIKTANLAAFSTEEYPDFLDLLQEYAAVFQKKGVRLTLLRQSPRYLLLVYRESLLRERLDHPPVQELLVREGYPLGEPLEAILAHLQARMAKGKDFPHEIGLFLGYPVEDVEGFRLHKGENYKFCGYWKVYSNVEQARHRFARYDKCRDALCRRIAQGQSIARVFGVA